MTDLQRLRTLSQTFTFPGATASEVAEVLAAAPLVGERSIFGNRKVASFTTEEDVRRLVGFEPAPVPLLRFDVETTQHRTDTGITITLEFSQPDRARPYLAGQFVWLLADGEGGAGATLEEEINTDTALQLVARPLHGSRFSLRRWLFFAGGHQRLMADVVANVRALVGGRA